MVYVFCSCNVVYWCPLVFQRRVTQKKKNGSNALMFIPQGILKRPSLSVMIGASVGKS